MNTSRVMDKDYRVEIKVKNNLLWQAIASTRCVSVKQFCDLHKLKPYDIYQYLNLKRTPVRLDGRWRPGVLKLARVLNTTPENLFPPQHIWDVLVKNTAALEMSYDDIERLPMNAAKMLTDNRTPENVVMETEINAALMESVNLLRPRERRVIEGRYGLGDEGPKTGEKIAEELGCSTARIYQLETMALRKLKGLYNPPTTGSPRGFRAIAKVIKDFDESI